VSQLKALLQYISGGIYSRERLEKAMSELGTSNTVELKVAEKIAFNVWIESGYEQEARDMFKLFDKKEKGTTTMEEIKNVLQSRIVVPVLDEDIEEIMQLMGVKLDSTINHYDIKK
jgi:Ca2+-binding EF-hand superfamily protein